jgi:hypothetical protein
MQKIKYHFHIHGWTEIPSIFEMLIIVSRFKLQRGHIEHADLIDTKGIISLDNALHGLRKKLTKRPKLYLWIIHKYELFFSQFAQGIYR